MICPTQHHCLSLWLDARAVLDVGLDPRCQCENYQYSAMTEESHHFGLIVTLQERAAGNSESFCPGLSVVLMRWTQVDLGFHTAGMASSHFRRVQRL